MMFRDFIIALSLVNLCFIRVWTEILNDVTANPYYLKTPLSIIDVIPLIATVPVLAVAIWIGATLARYSQRAYVLNLARWAFLLLLIIPLNSIRNDLSTLSLVGALTWLGETGAVLLVIVLSFAVLRWYKKIARVGATVVLMISPFILYTFFNSLWPFVNYAGTSFAEKPAAQVTPKSESQKLRVLWLLFDEMDQYVSFDGRPPDVQLKELDYFRSHAIYATKVSSPANDTLESMPALITGKLVSKVEPNGPNELMITFADSQKPVPWSLQPSMFSKAREAGVNTAVVGWNHPYCRVIGESLTHCSWEPSEASIGIRSGTTWFERMVWLPTLIDTVPLARHLHLKERIESALGITLPRRQSFWEANIPRYLSILKDAKNVVLDPDLGLILVHWPIPHPPGMYDRFKGAFAQTVRGDYLDNLALVDRTLGELRREMERAHLWENTTVLITADHPYRTATWKTSWKRDEKIVLESDHVGQYVTFLLKLAGQKQSFIYDRPFNSVLISDLFITLLRREIADPKKVVDWLDQHIQEKTKSTSEREGNKGQRVSVSDVGPAAALS